MGSKIYLAFGSNIGDKESNIKKAISLLSEKVNFLKESSLYETEPVGFKDQDYFLNSTALVETKLGVNELLNFTQQVERQLGKNTPFKDGPRTIDIDILFYNDESINEENLEVPHPRLHERAFVLVPLEEISPEYVHPKLKKTVKQLLSELKEKEFVKKI